MINFTFNIRNPWSNRFTVVLSKHFKTFFEFKFIEFEILKTADILGLSFNLTTRQSHAGIDASLCLLGYDMRFNFYDCRHWNHIMNRYEFHNE